MEIYTALKADHRAVKKLLKSLEATDERSVRKRTLLLRLLKEALVPHARAEERVLYDRLKRSGEDDVEDLAFESYEEHHVVDRLMEELEATSPEDKRWTALISVVKESLEHHIEEEEGELFKKARKSIDRRTAVAMSEEFIRLKAHFIQEVRAGKTQPQKFPRAA